MAIYDICMSDNRIIHLLGNHEDMCLRIFKSIMIEYDLHGKNAMYMLNLSDFEYQLWDFNGGRDFINALIDGRFKIDKLIELYLYMKSMPLIFSDEDYKLSHAGVNELGINDREFVLWNIKHQELLDVKQVVGHVFHDNGECAIDNIIYVDTSNFKNKLGVFELTEKKLFNIII